MLGSSFFHTNKLLIRLSEGDQLALAELMHLFKNNIYTSAFHILRSSDHAEEVVQDVFMIIWKKREMLGSVENFPAYLYGISRNVIYNALRNIAKQKARQLKHEIPLSQYAYSHEEGLLDQKEFLKIFDNAVKQLPEKQRMAFTLIRQDGFSREQAAARLGVSQETVKSNLEEAVRKVRAYCRKYLSLLF